MGGGTCGIDHTVNIITSPAFVSLLIVCANCVNFWSSTGLMYLCIPIVRYPPASRRQYLQHLRLVLCLRIDDQWIMIRMVGVRMPCQL